MVSVIEGFHCSLYCLERYLYCVYFMCVTIKLLGARTVLIVMIYTIYRFKVYFSRDLYFTNFKVMDAIREKQIREKQIREQSKPDHVHAQIELQFVKSKYTEKFMKSNSMLYMLVLQSIPYCYRVLSRNICLGKLSRLVGGVCGFSPENFEFQIARNAIQSNIRFTACNIRGEVWGEASPLPPPPTGQNPVLITSLIVPSIMILLHYCCYYC